MISYDTSIVQASHLARKAFLYVRQSSFRQVVENRESARRQYGLYERAQALGWAEEQIEVIDCDQGTSATRVADREGFRRLVTEVNLGRAGIVLGLEVSRLARKCSDWHRLVEQCAMTQTLILDQDGLYDPTTFNHQLVLGIKGFMSAFEIGVLRSRLRESLLAKAKRGELKVQLPVGFVYEEHGKVCLHPDAQVQQSIRLLFETFRRTGTACATVKYFGDQSLLFPRRKSRGNLSIEVIWKPLELAMVVAVLHNPRYAGAFAYGRHRTEIRPDGSSRVVNVPRDQWHSLVRDVHPGYIDWDEFERNEQQLRRSALAYGLDNRRSAPREGPALLQGLVLCGVCGDRMTVRYHDRAEGLVPDYVCAGRRLRQQRSVCQVIRGASVDRAVADRLLAAMTPMAIELTLAVRSELQTRIDEVDRLRTQQVERARHEAHLAERRYLKVDPDNRLVATTLEADWNDKLRALAQATELAQRQRAADLATLDEASEARIRALAHDFPAVWNGSATSHRDRKRMAQLLVEDVTLLKSDEVVVHIRFKGGAVESLTMPLPKSAWHERLTPPDVVTRIAELLEQFDEVEVAQRLNAEGLRTGAGAPFDKAAVRWVRYSRGLQTATERLRAAGMLTVSEMAVELAQTEATVRAWARQDRLRGTRQGRKPVWLFHPIDEQPEAIRKLANSHGDEQPDTPSQSSDSVPSKLRTRVEELILDGQHDAGVAEMLNAEGWSRASCLPFNASAIRKLRSACGLQTLRARLLEAGMLTTSEVATRLGVGLKTVSKWARSGHLRGRRCGTGPKARWVFHPIDEQPEPIRQRAAARGTLEVRRGLLSDAAIGRGAV